MNRVLTSTHQCSNVLLALFFNGRNFCLIITFSRTANFDDGMLLHSMMDSLMCENIEVSTAAIVAILALIIVIAVRFINMRDKIHDGFFNDGPYDKICIAIRAN